MADGITANYSFTLPEVGASADSWGGKLNDNWTALDALLDSLQTDVDARIELDDIATAAEFRAGTAGKVIDAAGAYAGNVPVTSSGSGSFAPDFSAGRNFQRTLNGNSTLANPTNQAAGQYGLIVIRQDSTGGRTLAFGAHWKFAAGSPGVSVSPNSYTVISYFVLESGTIMASQTAGIV